MLGHASPLTAMLAPFALAVASCTGAPDVPSAVAIEGPLRIDGLLPSPDSFDDRALEALGAEDVVWSQHGETWRYRGVSLAKVLARCGLDGGTGGPGADPRTKHMGWRRVVLATAADGFQAVFSSAELMPEIGATRALVVWAKDGNGIPEPEGPRRLLVPTDHKGSRSLRSVVRISVCAAPDVP